MTELEKKSLKLILKHLESIDTFDLYRQLNKVFDELKTDDESKKKIASSHDGPSANINTHLREAKEWLNILINEKP